MNDLVRTCSLSVATFAMSLACQGPPDDLREWQPSDHTNTGQSGAERKGQSTGTETPNPMGLDQVTLSAWQNNCVSCHGKVGRGDGPQGPMYQPRDLTDPAFQSAVTDDALLASIQNGKGKMPGFALPLPTAKGLVRLVRLLGGAQAAGATTATSAPSASGPPNVVGVGSTSPSPAVSPPKPVATGTGVPPAMPRAPSAAVPGPPPSAAPR